MSHEGSHELQHINFLRKKIESSLIFGPKVGNSTSIFDVDTSPQFFHDQSERQAFWRDTKEEIDELSECSKTTVLPIFQGMRNKCDEVELYLSQLKVIDDSNSEIVHSFLSYVRTEYKIQLLQMVKLLKNLDQSSNILDVPQIVISLKEVAKVTILEKSNIYSFMTNIIRIKKSKLLKKFHKLFEEHLDAEITQQAAEVSASNGADMYDGQKQIWRKFLQRSRQWLLSYAMVSILPPCIIHSSKMVTERFKEALDEAMTPLWGRFYHHLKMGRESYSRDQILWTFKYAVSFIEMLHGLCDHITAADEMRHMVGSSEIDFHNLAKTQVLEKSLKFLNAHLASIFVLASPWDDSFGLQLVDEIFEFDTWLSAYNPPSYLCHILYESKIFFHHWMMLEQSLFYRHFSPDNVDIDSETAFARKFNTPLNPTPEPSGLSMMKRAAERFVSTDKTENLQCYSFLYDALQFFLLARQRYVFFPPAAQYLLSDLILEPLLCLSLGLCLYAMRCSPLLFSISMGQSSSTEVTSALRNFLLQSAFPEQFLLFKDSISYFQTALDAATEEQNHTESSSVMQRIVAHESRCKKRWTIVQEWLPKLYLSKDLRQQGYAVSNLVKTAMKVSDKYRNHQNYAYRNQWIEFQQQQSSTQNAVASHRHNHHSGNHDNSADLDACVIMTRGLAITMANVLDEQWQSMVSKYHS